MRSSRTWRLGLSAVAMLAIVSAGVRTVRSQDTQTFTAKDYFEIQELYAQYTRGVDMGHCFADNPGCPMYVDTFVERSPQSVVTFHDRLSREGWASRHTYTGLLITPTPEGADGSVYALIFNATANPPFVDHSVYYDDKLVRTPKGWRFKERKIYNNQQFKPSMPWTGP